MRLSDAYVKRQEELELTVTVYNINRGNNEELMEACSLLKEYACYVEKVREYAAEMEFPEAVERAVDYCIRNGILTEFLSGNRAEAIAVSIFEYNEEQHIRSEREQAYKSGKDDGMAEGREEGRIEGEARLVKLLQILENEGRDEDVRLAISDQAYREQLYREKQL